MSFNGHGDDYGFVILIKFLSFYIKLYGVMIYHQVVCEFLSFSQDY